MWADSYCELWWRTSWLQRYFSNALFLYWSRLHFNTYFKLNMASSYRGLKGDLRSDWLRNQQLQSWNFDKKHCGQWKTWRALGGSHSRIYLYPWYGVFNALSSLMFCRGRVDLLIMKGDIQKRMYLRYMNWKVFHGNIDTADNFYRYLVIRHRWIFHIFLSLCCQVIRHLLMNANTPTWKDQLFSEGEFSLNKTWNKK